MNEAASLIAAAVTAGAVLLTSGSAAAPRPPPPTIELYVTESAPPHVHALEPGLRPAGDDDLSRILDCTIELDGGRLVFSGAKLFSHIGSKTTFAVIGGTGCYAGAEGDVTGTPSTVDDQAVSHRTSCLSQT